MLRYYLGNPVGKFWVRYLPKNIEGKELKKFECYTHPAKPFFTLKRQLKAKLPLLFEINSGGRYHFNFTGGGKGCKLEKLGERNKTLSEKCSGTLELDSGTYRFTASGRGELSLKRLPLSLKSKFWKKNRAFFGEESCKITVEKFEKGRKYRLIADAVLSPQRLKRKKSAQLKKSKQTKKSEQKISYIKVKLLAIIEAQ